MKLFMKSTGMLDCTLNPMLLLSHGSNRARLIPATILNIRLLAHAAGLVRAGERVAVRSADLAAASALRTVHAMLGLVALCMHLALVLLHLAAALALVAAIVIFLAFGFLEDVRIARNLHALAAANGTAFSSALLFHVMSSAGHILYFLLCALIRGLGCRLEAVLIDAEERRRVGRSA